MKKFVLLVFIVLLKDVCIFAQSWTIRIEIEDDQAGEVDYK